MPPTHKTCCGDCAEDERRLTAEQDPPPSSNYGAVPTDDFTDAPHQHGQDESPQGLGFGARLYLGVLAIVGLTGLVSFVCLCLRSSCFCLFLSPL